MRIPKSFAEEAQVEVGSTVDLSIEDGDLVIRPPRRRYDLRSLVKAINENNIHDSLDMGEPVGREDW